jgi:replicative DNA helicase
MRGLVSTSGEQACASPRSSARPLPNLLGELLDDVESRGKSKFSGDLETGILELDGLLNGLRARELVVIGGRPGVGKSSFLLQILDSVGIDQRLPVLFFSLELSALEATERLLALQAGVPTDFLRSGRMPKRLWSRIGEVVANMADCPVFIHEGPLVGAADVRDVVRQMKDEPYLVLIDSVQCMWSEATFERKDQPSEVFGLRLIAREFDVPVVVSSQLSERGTHTEPHSSQLTSLKGYEDLDDCDAIVILEVGESNGTPSAPTERNFEMFCIKNRFGPTGSAKTQLKLQRLYNVEMSVSFKKDEAE